VGGGVLRESQPAPSEHLQNTEKNQNASKKKEEDGARSEGEKREGEKAEARTRGGFFFDYQKPRTYRKAKGGGGAKKRVKRPFLSSRPAARRGEARKHKGTTL